MSKLGLQQPSKLWTIHHWDGNAKRFEASLKTTFWYNKVSRTKPFKKSEERKKQST